MRAFLSLWKGLPWVKPTEGIAIGREHFTPSKEKEIKRNKKIIQASCRFSQCIAIEDKNPRRVINTQVTWGGFPWQSVRSCTSMIALVYPPLCIGYGTWMSDHATTRLPGSKARKPHCVLCGSTRDVELHHVGGRHHIAWFTIPLCRIHHLRVTAALRVAGVNMSFTPDTRERFSRVRMATLVFLSLVEEELKDYEQNRQKQ